MLLISMPLPEDIMAPTASTFSTVPARRTTSSASATASSRLMPSGMVTVRLTLFISIWGMNTKPRLTAPHAEPASSTTASSSTMALWPSDQPTALR